MYYFVVVSTIVESNKQKYKNKNRENRKKMKNCKKICSVIWTICIRTTYLIWNETKIPIKILLYVCGSFLLFVLFCFRWLVVIVLPLNATCGRNISNNERIEPNCGRWFSSLFIRCIQFQSDKRYWHNTIYNILAQWKSDQSHSVRHSVFFYQEIVQNGRMKHKMRNTPTWYWY